MILLLRTIKVLIAALFRRRLLPMGESVVRLRVWPNDIDLNLHLNNGRYLSFMDLGRLDLVVRTGLGRAALHGRWRPMVAALTIRYRQPIKPLAVIRLRTKLISWDDKFFYIEQKLEHDEVLCAQAMVKAIFVGPREKINPQAVAQAIGYTGPPPPLPEAVQSWRHWEELCRL